MTHLTEHFTLEELTHSEAALRNGWDNTPNGDEVANLTRLAQLLEQVKTAVGGKPVMINSGFRSKKVNDSVGSKDSSQHRLGCAADIRVPGMTPRQVVDASAFEQDLPFGGLDQPGDAPPHSGFAAACLPHEAERLAAGQGEGHPVDGLYLAAGRADQPPPPGIVLDQPVHFQERGRHGIGRRHACPLGLSSAR